MQIYELLAFAFPRIHIFICDSVLTRLPKHTIHTKHTFSYIETSTDTELHFHFPAQLCRCLRKNVRSAFLRCHVAGGSKMLRICSPHVNVPFRDTLSTKRMCAHAHTQRNCCACVSMYVYIHGFCVCVCGAVRRQHCAPPLLLPHTASCTYEQNACSSCCANKHKNTHLLALREERWRRQMPAVPGLASCASIRPRGSIENVTQIYIYSQFHRAVHELGESEWERKKERWKEVG